MKFGPVPKLDKRSKTTSKIDIDVMSKDCDVIAIFQFTANLEQFESQMSDA